MGFLLFCAIMAFLLQMLICSQTPSGSRLRVLPLLLELFPLAGILYYAVTRPGGFFDWRANIAFLLWIAGAIALGCGIAMLCHLCGKKE